MKNNFCFTFITASLFFLVIVLAFSCVNDNYREQDESNLPSAGNKDAKTMYKNIALDITSVKSLWKGNPISYESAEIKEMRLNFDFELYPPDLKTLPLSTNKQDTFSKTILNVQVLFNNQPIVFDIPETNTSWMKNTSLNRSSNSSLLFSTDPIHLKSHKRMNLSLPLFVFSKIKANTMGKVSIRVWQDFFISDEKSKLARVDGVNQTIYYEDTLKTKLIDNSYTFSLTIPEIYKSDILCDSIILQNDKDWSPTGSDNTIWKSSYPDIYFTLCDLYANTQNASEIEKSTSKYTIGDTLPFFHYSANEPFYINVYDYDVLSRDDALGEWKGELKYLKSNKKQVISFGHVSRFYLRKQDHGRIN